MKYTLDYEISDKKINMKLMIFGMVFLIYRLYSMRAFINPYGTLPQGMEGYFHPTVLHASYFVSLCLCFSMILSFRVKLFNAISVVVLPTVLISFPFKDIPILINPEAAGHPGHVIGDLFWWNYVGLHWPILVVGFYFIFTRKETLSKESLWLAFFVLITWFICIDDLDNGVLNGITYFVIAVSVISIWNLFVSFVLMKNIRPEDPLIAPVLTLNSLKLKKIKQE